MALEGLVRGRLSAKCLLKSRRPSRPNPEIVLIIASDDDGPGHSQAHARGRDMEMMKKTEKKTEGVINFRGIYKIKRHFPTQRGSTVILSS